MTSATPDLFAVFSEAVALEAPADQSKYLDEACGDDSEFRSRVEALDAYRTFLDLARDLSDPYVEPISFHYDLICQRIEAQYRIGRILAFELNRTDEGKKELETLVRDYGLSHQAGPDARVAMHKLKMETRVPADTALIWGGNTSTLNGWKTLLATENLGAHALRRSDEVGFSLSDLAPYQLVIVSRSGGTPLTPSEVMALRTYVASGGSLLVVAAPMWKTAASAADNSLLSLFDMEVEVGAIGNARSTKIVPHPITEGVMEFTSPQAAGLRAPPESILVRAGDKGLLAAREYGRGRVVVATIGQWYTPEFLLVPEITAGPPRKVINPPQHPENYEHIRGLNPEPPLLRQTLHWLREPREQDPSFVEWHKDWKSAVESFVRAQARIMPVEDRIVEWTDLPEIFDRLVAGAPNPDLKELSLWTAGECLLEKGHYNLEGQRAPLGWERSGRRLWDYSLPVERKFYQRLVKDFRDSPLYEHAQYRLACAELAHRNPNDERAWDAEEVDLVRSLAQPFEQLNLKPGTYPHAWAKLDAGQVCYVIDDVEQAAKHYEEVVESMPVSAEKALAVFNLAKCRALQGDIPTARRLLAQVDGLPNFDCGERYSQFVACSYRTYKLMQDARTELRVMSEYTTPALDKLAQNPEYQKWNTERKQRLKLPKQQARKPK